MNEERVIEERRVSEKQEKVRRETEEKEEIVFFVQYREEK